VKPVSKQTLESVVEEFSTLPWAGGELDELVAPKFGIITGFQGLVNDLERLRGIDLGETALAGPLRHPGPG
jgi:hypothetical protein